MRQQILSGCLQLRCISVCTEMAVDMSILIQSFCRKASCKCHPISAVFWTRVPLVSEKDQGLLKSSRKYQPLTQGCGLNPHHDGSSTERDEPNEFLCVAQRHIILKRAQTAHNLSFRLFV